MSWWAIDVRIAPERRDRLSAWLVSRTGQAVEERDDGTLVAFAEGEAAADALVAELRATGDPPPEVVLRRVDEVDWTTRWREGLGPRRFGRLTVVPSWVPGAATLGAATVVLDPESAFGSGEHGSTRAALTLLERHLRAGDLVLDLGSGSGILAIAAVRLGARRAIGMEVDADANEVAARNAERNRVAHGTEFLEGDAATLAPLLGPADLLLSNILRTTNTALLPAVRQALRPEGIAVFSGMEEPEAPLFRPALLAAGFQPVDETVDTGWCAVAAQRA